MRSPLNRFLSPASLFQSTDRPSGLIAGLFLATIATVAPPMNLSQCQAEETTKTATAKTPTATSPTTNTSTLAKVVDALKNSIDADDANGESATDPMREMQSNAMREQSAPWGHWGNQPKKYSSWTNHSNRLVPLYSFGMTLSTLRERGSLYSDAERMKKHFGRIPAGTLNPVANYHDQIDVYELQRLAVEQGKRHVILMVFDGTDWQTTRAATIYQNRADLYDSGRGRGLSFQDYRGVQTDFAFIGTTPRTGGTKLDVNSQTIVDVNKKATGGFDPDFAGPMPWHERDRIAYPIGKDREQPHTVTDSASSATSLTCGIKTYNGSVGIAHDGTHAISIGRQLQNEGFRVGVVTCVPVSHATPGAAYANNVSRGDYQDIARDMIGRPSSSHRRDPLPGVDVLIGGGWGEGVGKDGGQGENFMPGNKYLHESDLDAVRLQPGETDPSRRKYVVAERTIGRRGSEVLAEAASRAIKTGDRLLGYFGTKGGHLPFQTADGNYNPTFDVKGTERYTAEDVNENPTLADMTTAALHVLSAPTPGEANDDQAELPKFWMMLEAGDVDWANHANNIDNSIGAVLSGDAAFRAVTKWAEDNNAWDDTVVFVTSDHGHYLVLDDPQAIAAANVSQ
ncbi:alkaline phosphatase [Rhodopirellula sp. SWK7]|uniref:alkaline phosphatase n=1 Tax=Rhodopirellula sp. SWK7 TaxID=595460 RepID=UPI0002C0133E|nr:alkaline phosphatase [Rhodopirellula sp. SWK7]EMI41255.1 alkaline phosphatase [Rhodopirellula sp. SWK7]